MFVPFLSDISFGKYPFRQMQNLKREGYNAVTNTTKAVYKRYTGNEPFDTEVSTHFLN
jgi:hypothetical protein